jgi:hypothetical protein
MKKIIGFLSVAILLILSYGMAIGAPPNNVSNVNVVNTPNVIVSKTVTQLLYSATSYALPALTVAPLATIDVSSCDSIRLTFSMSYSNSLTAPAVSCALVDNLDPQAVVAGAEASPNIANLTGHSASLEVQTPSSDSLKIICVNTDLSVPATVSVALYCR